MNSAGYIDLLKDLNKWSDSEAARQLGLTRQAVSSYRNNNVEFDDQVALKVAELLSLEPLEVIASVHAARTKDKTVRDFWKSIAGNAAAITLIFGSAALSPQPTDINDITAQRTSEVSILCKIGY